LQVFGISFVPGGQGEAVPLLSEVRYVIEASYEGTNKVAKLRLLIDGEIIYSDGY
jgi:hypothetical protein